MHDELIPLEEAAKMFPGTMSRRALIRRITRGVYGVKLNAVFDGCRYLTTKRWVQDFLQEQTRRRTGQIERVQIVPVEELMERFRKVCASKTANKGKRRKAHEQ